MHVTLRFRLLLESQSRRIKGPSRAQDKGLYEVGRVATPVSAYTCVSACVCMFMCVPVPARVRMFLCVCMCVCACVYLPVCARVYMYLCV